MNGHELRAMLDAYDPSLPVLAVTGIVARVYEGRNLETGARAIVLAPARNPNPGYWARTS